MGVYESILKGLQEAADYENGNGEARVTSALQILRLNLTHSRLRMFGFPLE